APRQAEHHRLMRQHDLLKPASAQFHRIPSPLPINTHTLPLLNAKSSISFIFRSLSESFFSY
ncbi:MAG TPA: hypothetical protein VGB94_02890, partial [Acidobacteriaceae bacterium]